MLPTEMISFYFFSVSIFLIGVEERENFLLIWVRGYVFARLLNNYQNNY